MMASEGTPPTRRTVARKALRETVVAVVAWTAGGWVLWRFGHGALESDVGLLYVALAFAIVIGVVLTTIWQRRLPHGPVWRKSGYDIRWAIGSLLFCLTLPAVGRALDVSRTMTALEVWIGFGFIGAFAASVEYGAKLIRPQGFVVARPMGATPIHAVVLVVALCVASLSAWWIADGIVGAGHIVPVVFQDLPPDVVQDFQPTIPLIAFGGWALIAAVATGGLALWWVGVPRAFFLAGAALYVGLVFWSEAVWRDIRAGDLVLSQAPEGLLVAQVLSGVLLLTAIGAASVFRPGRSLIQTRGEPPQYSMIH